MATILRNILVLCEGNICRSPLAEALLQKSLGSDVKVRSAGLGALVGKPAHEETLRTAEALGLDLCSHRGSQLNQDIALQADLILVMDRAQKEACERRVPSTRGRVFLLGQWLPAGEQEIPDPIGREPETHRRIHDHIQRAIPLWLSRLNPMIRRIP